MKNSFSVVALTLFLCAVSFGQVPKDPRTSDKRPTATGQTSKLTNSPDLKITSVRYDAGNCSIYVEVANTGAADARAFNLWAKLDGLQKNVDKSVAGLAGNKREWVSLSVSDGGKCMRDSLTGIKAVADASYFKSDTAKVGELAVGMPPAGMKLVPASVTESDEANNQLTITSVDIRPHAP